MEQAPHAALPELANAAVQPELALGPQVPPDAGANALGIDNQPVVGITRCRRDSRDPRQTALEEIAAKGRRQRHCCDAFPWPMPDLRIGETWPRVHLRAGGGGKAGRSLGNIRAACKLGDGCHGMPTYQPGLLSCMPSKTGLLGAARCNGLPHKGAGLWLSVPIASDEA